MTTLDWLMLPISGSADHHIPGWLAWHARSMVLGWGILVPLGVLVARFFKITCRQDWPHELDNKFWWHSHLFCQYSGILAMSIGFVLALVYGSGFGSGWAEFHGLIGWGTVMLGYSQVVAGILRGSKGGPGISGDHYDMTRRRLVFERFHKSAGYVAMLCSVVAILSGLWIADAPRWMWLTLCLWWIAYAVAFAHLQRKGRCIDTYQAIWGADTSHPGNKMAAIGPGIRRLRPGERFTDT